MYHACPQPPQLPHAAHNYLGAGSSFMDSSQEEEFDTEAELALLEQIDIMQVRCS